MTSKILNISSINCIYYSAMLAQSAVMRLLSSVRPSVCNDQVPCSNTLEFFENNFRAKQLKVHALVDAQIGDLVQREHPQSWG